MRHQEVNDGREKYRKIREKDDKLRTGVERGKKYIDTTKGGKAVWKRMTKGVKTWEIIMQASGALVDVWIQPWRGADAWRWEPTRRRWWRGDGAARGGMEMRAARLSDGLARRFLLLSFWLIWRFGLLFFWLKLILVATFLSDMKFVSFSCYLNWRFSATFCIFWFLLILFWMTWTFSDSLLNVLNVFW